MSGRRAYSDEEKARALVVLTACGDDLRQASEKLGIPFKTLEAWHSGRGVQPHHLQMQEAKKEDLADKFEEIARELVDAIPSKIQGASLQAVATSAAIAVDKMRLLREQPTQISRDDTLTDDERAEEAQSLLDTWRARAVRQPASSQPSPPPN